MTERLYLNLFLSERCFRVFEGIYNCHEEGRVLAHAIEQWRFCEPICRPSTIRLKVTESDVDGCLSSLTHSLEPPLRFLPLTAYQTRWWLAPTWMRRCLRRLTRQGFVALASAVAFGVASFSMPTCANEVVPQVVQSKADRPTLRVGILAYSPPWYDGTFIDESFRYLAWKLPGVQFDINYMGPKALSAKIEAGELDLVATSAALYLQEAGKLRDLASLVSDTAESANTGAGAAVVVRAEREDLQTLEDLKGKRLAAMTDELTPGIWELNAELVAMGEEPDHFFGQIVREEPLHMRQVIERVLKGDVDAGVVRACYLEDLWRAGSEDYRNELRVIVHPGGDDGLRCMHSTEAYPGWLLASTDSLPEKTAREVTALLLTKPVNAWGQYWSMTTDYSRALDMLKRLKVGPYSYLREWTLARIWREFWPWITLLGFILMGLFVRGVVVEKLVRRRTAELERVHAMQQAAEQQARETTEKFEALQRLGVVGQMSSIVAHEMKQPLAAIQNLSRGAQRVIEDEPETLEDVSDAIDRISREATRAAAILDRVRSYGQGHSNRQPMPLGTSVQKVLKDFRASRKARMVRVETGEMADPVVVMDPMDLELIVMNLVKNGAEAAANQPDACVRVAVKISDNMAVLTVEDNGPRLTDEAFDRLGESVLRTTKANGLGLGVMIVRNLAEGYVGRLTFKRAEPHGTKAIVTLPIAKTKEIEAKTNTTSVVNQEG